MGNRVHRSEPLGSSPLDRPPLGRRGLPDREERRPASPSGGDDRAHRAESIRLGGIAFILVGIGYAICLYLTVGGAPGSGCGAAEYLASVSGHLGPNAALWVTYRVGDLLLIPARWSRFLLLRPFGRPSLAAGFGRLAAYVGFDLAVTEPDGLALTLLAPDYGAAATAAQRTAYVAAAQYALALVPVINALNFVVSATGFLLVLASMRSSPIRRGTPDFGVAVMGLAMLAGASWFVPSLGPAVLACLGGFAFSTMAVGAPMVRPGRSPDGVPGPAPVTTAWAAPRSRSR